MILFSFIFWWDFIESFKQSSNLSNELQKANEQFEDLKSDLSFYENKQTYLKKIQDKNSNIFMCINFGECSSLNNELVKELENNPYKYRAYLALTELNQDKMDFDQQVLLKNINEFLLESNWESLWELNSISFSNIEKENFSNDIYSLPISMSINFEDKEALLNFLDNLENRVYQSTPIFYTVSNINYDVVNYEEAQDVALNIKAYFYK